MKKSIIALCLSKNDLDFLISSFSSYENSLLVVGIVKITINKIVETPINCLTQKSEKMSDEVVKESIVAITPSSKA